MRKRMDRRRKKSNVTYIERMIADIVIGEEDKEEDKEEE
jgi:hypothetical protein